MSGKNMALELLEKENQVVYKRHVEGKGFKVIAEELGYTNASGAQKAYKRGVARISQPDREEYLKAHIDRIDAIIESLTIPATQGNLKALYGLLKAMEYQADLLSLKGPIKIEQEVKHNGFRNLEADVVRIARVIEYIEGTAADIATITGEHDQGEPNTLESPSAQRTITT